MEIIIFNLSNKIIKFKFLINIKVINYIFLYKKYMNIIYNILLIFLIRLFKAQYLCFFKRKKAKLIIYIIYLNIMVFNYFKYFYFIIITNLNSYNRKLK